MGKWEIEKLDNCFSQIRNGASIKQGIIDGGYPITRIETIADYEVNRDKMGYAGITDITKFESYVLQNGDLLMSHINSEKHLGKTACYEKKDNEVIIHGMNLLRLRPLHLKTDYKYAKYYFLSNFFKNQIPTITKKSVNQASFTVTALKEFFVPLPPLEVQHKIAETLDAASELLVMRKTQLAELDELIQAVFYEMFGDPVANEKGWNVEQLDKILTFVRNGASIQQGVFPGGFPITRIETISNATIDRSKFGFAGITDIKQYGSYVLQNDDILMSHINSIKHLGKAAVYKKLDSEIIIHGMNLLCLRPMHFIVKSDYLIYYFKTEAFRIQIMGITKPAVNQASFTTKALKNLQLPVPPLVLQTQFAEIVQKIEEQKALVKKAIDETQALFDSLMGEFFG